jgi:hypothetical protein
MAIKRSSWLEAVSCGAKSPCQNPPILHQAHQKRIQQMKNQKFRDKNCSKKQSRQNKDNPKDESLPVLQQRVTHWQQQVHRLAQLVQ